MAFTDVKESDIVSIVDFFCELEDPRSPINRCHLLSDLLVICIAAVISGCDGPKAIGGWAIAKKSWCEKHLQLPGGIPSHDTIGRVLALLKPAAFQACFEKWIEHTQIDPEFIGPLLQRQIAIDGKALRRSHDRRNGLGPLFLVSAWAVERGISLGQLATEEKSNEITAIPQLIDSIEIKGTVVTIDAAGCQKNIAKKIVDAGGDYVLALKGNQRNMHKRIIALTDELFAKDWSGISFEQYDAKEKGHGRIDLFSYIQFPVPESLEGREQWAGLKSIGLASRISESANKETIDTRYYLCSTDVNITQFARNVRQHWSIENTLHWCLDVTFREDESRLRNRIAGENMAWLKRFTISLLKQVPDKESIAMRRRMAGWNDDYLTQVLGI